jgi:hypothetical protein
MTTVDIVLLALTIICALATLLFALRGLLIRPVQAHKPYGVARQQARHEMQVQFVRAGFSFVLTLILLGIYGLAAGDTGLPQGLTETPAIELTGTQVEATVTSQQPQEATPTSGPAGGLTATATLTPTVTATATQTPAPESALVNSPSGLWLREAPGGTQQLELLDNEARLELLPGHETVDGVEWQQVRTPSGNEGWVAAEYLSYAN